MYAFDFQREFQKVECSLVSATIGTDRSICDTDGENSSIDLTEKMPSTVARGALGPILTGMTKVRTLDPDKFSRLIQAL